MAKKPAEFSITSPQHWKALSHPLRVGILQRLSHGSMTNEQLANALAVESGKLYFHTKRLLDAGMIEIAETRAKGPITEKYYRAVAQRFTAPDASHGGDRPPLEFALSAGLELYRAAWSETDGLANEWEFGYHLVLPQSAERIAELVTRLRALAAEFQENGPLLDGGRTVALSMLLHTLPIPPRQSEPAPADPPRVQTPTADEGESLA